MRRPYFKNVVSAFLFFFVLGSPSASFSQELTFTPTLYSMHSALELDLSQQMTEYHQGDQTTKTASRAWGEKFNVSAIGYVYHPRFLVFMANLSEGLSQAHATNYGSQSGTTTDYELRTTFLPEHPYNLELFAVHRATAANATFLQGPSDTIDQKGVLFRYQNRPFSFSTSYHEDSMNSTVNAVDTQSYRANAGYANALTSNSADYSHRDSTSSHGVHSTNEGYGFSNDIHFADTALNSSIRRSESDQMSPINPESQTSTLTWTEHLIVPLPLHFSSRFSYEYQDDVNRTAADSTTPAEEKFNRSSSTSFNLSHRLYQSLNTQYTISDLSSRSTLGEYSARSEMIGSTYTKIIPTAVLTAGVQFSKTQAERFGTPVILSEKQSAVLFGWFRLRQQHVIENTIAVQVTDPATEALITMPPSYYQLDRLGNEIQITITNVPIEVLQVDPAYRYEFTITYSLSDQSTISTDAQGYSLRLDFLENLLSTYYGYVNSNQELVSGSLPGGPDKSSAETIGMTCRVSEYSGSMERQRTWSTTNPSESRRAELGYRTPYSENTNISIHLTYSLVDYLPTASPGGNTDGYQQKVMGTNVTMDKKFPDKKLTFFATGTYNRTRSNVTSDMFILNTYLIWQIGVLSVNTGAQVSHATSQTSLGKGSLISNSVYVTLNRKLF